MKNIRIERPFLAFGATLLASLVAFADDAAILSSPTDVRDLLRDAQAARLPSPNVVTQDLGAAVVEPADASASAWFSAVGDGAAFAFEDPADVDPTAITLSPVWDHVSIEPLGPPTWRGIPLRLAVGAEMVSSWEFPKTFYLTIPDHGVASVYFEKIAPSSDAESENR